MNHADAPNFHTYFANQPIPLSFDLHNFCGIHETFTVIRVFIFSNIFTFSLVGISFASATENLFNRISFARCANELLDHHVDQLLLSHWLYEIKVNEGIEGEKRLTQDTFSTRKQWKISSTQLWRDMIQ